MSDSPRLVGFAIGLENSVINLPDGQVRFFEESKLQRNCEINLLIKTFLGPIEMMFVRGGYRIFSRRGCTRLLLYFNTIKHFFRRIPVVLENRGSFHRGGVRTPCTLPLDPPLFVLVNVSFSLPEWQAVKAIFFAPCSYGK